MKTGVISGVEVDLVDPIEIEASGGSTESEIIRKLGLHNAIMAGVSLRYEDLITTIGKEAADVAVYEIVEAIKIKFEGTDLPRKTNLFEYRIEDSESPATLFLSYYAANQEERERANDEFKRIIDELAQDFKNRQSVVYTNQVTRTTRAIKQALMSHNGKTINEKDIDHFVQSIVTEMQVARLLPIPGKGIE